MIVDEHGFHTALHLGVKATENQDKVPTLYQLPKLHKNPYKARFIANSSSCTTTELSKLLTACLKAVKKMLSTTVKRYMRDPVKTYFGLLKIQVKFYINLKLEISMRPVCLLMIFSTLYTILPHNLIKDKLTDLIEKKTFQREGSPYLACNVRNAFFTSAKHKEISCMVMSKCT